MSEQFCLLFTKSELDEWTDERDSQKHHAFADTGIKNSKYCSKNFTVYNGL